MDITHCAAILAIGTELTDGQTLNRNSQWISERLTELKYKVRSHETIPDDREQIQDSLERLSKRASFIFVTGGLGPTTDDFTREVVANWLGTPLVWNESSWLNIVDRLTRFGITIAESNRQQCHFPSEARVFSNQAGTAAGFAVKKGETSVYVLPGPPRELEAIWTDHLASELTHLAPQSTVRKLSLWRCIGKSESALGEIVEDALKGSGLEIGYRAHMPFIEIKVWCAETRIDEALPWFSRLENAISPWLVSRGEEDLALEFFKCFHNREVHIFDQGTEGQLAQRLGGVFGKERLRVETAFPGASVSSDEEFQTTLENGGKGGLFFALTAPDSHERWKVGMNSGGKLFFRTETLPFRSEMLKDRVRLYLRELALFHWLNWLREDDRK